MISELNNEQKKEFKQIFNIFDLDDNGHIEFKEFYNVLRKFGITRTEYEIREMFDEMDDNTEYSKQYNIE